jgi:hypothetical protein
MYVTYTKSISRGAFINRYRCPDVSTVPILLLGPTALRTARAILIEANGQHLDWRMRCIQIGGAGGAYSFSNTAYMQRDKPNTLFELLRRP